MGHIVCGGTRTECLGWFGGFDRPVVDVLWMCELYYDCWFGVVEMLEY